MAGFKSKSFSKDHSAAPFFPCFRLPRASTKKRFFSSRKRIFFRRYFACARSITARVEGVAQAITGEIEGEEHRNQNAAGKNDHPPVDADGIDLRGAFREQRAEAGLRRLDAEAEVAEK